MRVIGTAGHVDHGKSTLVQALTGTHPDRLKEEREREMTIDLGFAWLTLPKSEALTDGEEVGIVDVPGHRDFIENMLAGVGGIDAVLFVIAADEGVMPQTREHLAILDLLQIHAGIVVLTKIDLAPDAEWLELITEDIRLLMRNTVLESAPIAPVSARTGQGLPELKQVLAACLAEQPPRLDMGRPRLPVDRVFTMAGFGTVVTGTLLDGVLQVGDEVELLAGEREKLTGRVRGLQTHKKKESAAVPGSRTAANVTGLEVSDIQRGCVIAHPGDYQASRRLDVHFRLLADASLPLEHSAEVKLFIGAAEKIARVRLLGVERLNPGDSGFLQLELEAPVVTVRGDHYILRRPSPGETLGGGIILDAHPRQRYKRFAVDTLQYLQALTVGSPVEVFYQALARSGAVTIQECSDRSGLSNDAARQALEELRASHQVHVVDSDSGVAALPFSALICTQAYWDSLRLRALQEVKAFHQAYPLRRGLPREELKSRLRLAPRIFSPLVRSLLNDERLVEAGSLIWDADHTIRLDLQQQKQVDRLMARFISSPYAPPSVKECLGEIKDDLYTALLELGELIQLSPEVVFRRKDYNQMVAGVCMLIQQHGPITAAQVRDHFNTSRRYALALLEHLDATGITVREGDFRRLKTSQNPV